MLAVLIIVCKFSNLLTKVGGFLYIRINVKFFMLAFGRLSSRAGFASFF